MNFDTIINGYHISASYSDREINEIFIPLLKELTSLQKNLDRRILVMLAAPPATGKTTLLAFLKKLSIETEDITECQTIGMDGFHRRQEYLLSHTVMCNGKQVPMVDIKGAPITFDLPALTERIKEITKGGTVSWPDYDRTLHNPVDNAICVTGNIIILEGNYLLLNRDGWRELSQFADYTIKITADEAMLKKRLIKRKMAGGTSYERSVEFVDFSDMSNVSECLQYSMDADLELVLTENGFSPRSNL